LEGKGKGMACCTQGLPLLITIHSPSPSSPTTTQWDCNCDNGGVTRHNKEACRAWEGGGVDDEGGGWAVVPILQNGSVFFFFFSLYYTDINYSTPGTPENKCSYLFSGVVGIL